MATRISTAARNASVAAVAALLNGGSVEIRTGSQPADVQTAATGALLGTLTLSATAFAAPSNGAAVANAVTGDSSADASGVAGWFRAKGSGGAGVIDGAITVNGGGGEMTMPDTNIIAGGTINISSWTVGQGAG